MEKQIKTMEKVMRVALMGCLTVWGFFSQGKVLGAVLAVVMVLLVIGMNKNSQSIDERQLQTHLLSCYGAFICTICFILIMQTVEFMRTAHVSPIYGYTLAVLMLSQLAFQVAFKAGR